MLRHSSIPIILTLVCAFMMPLSAQEESEESPVIRIQECQITLATERLLASGESGIVVAMHVREGDRIREGQLLAELDASVPKATLAIAVKEANNDVNVRFAKAAARVATAEYDSALQANKKQLKTFSAIEMKKLRLEEERSILGIEVSRHEFEISQLRRDEAASLVDSYRIVAPMNGIVSRVFKSPGEAAQVGESMLQCQSTDKVYVEAQVDIQLLNLVRKGRTVNVIPLIPHPAVKTDGRGVEGTVFFVGVFADLGKSVRVLVEVDNQNGLFLAGTEAVIEIVPVPTPERSATARRD